MHKIRRKKGFITHNKYYIYENLLPDSVKNKKVTIQIYRKQLKNHMKHLAKSCPRRHPDFTSK